MVEGHNWKGTYNDVISTLKSDVVGEHGVAEK